MVEQPRSCNPLLVSSAQGVRPVLLRVPPALSFNDAVQLNDLEALEQLVVRPVCFGRWVNDLVAQIAEREVGSLRDVGEVFGWRLVDGSTCEDPFRSILVSWLI